MENKDDKVSKYLFRKAMRSLFDEAERNVVPRTEDFIVDLFSSTLGGICDLVISSFKHLIYQDTSSDRLLDSPRRRKRGEHEYDDYYNRRSRGRDRDRERRRDDGPLDFTDGLVSCRSYEEIIYNKRDTAYAFLERLKKDLNVYKEVRVDTVYEYLKKTGGDMSDSYTGWKNLDRARIQAIGGQYHVRLPEPIEFD